VRTSFTWESVRELGGDSSLVVNCGSKKDCQSTVLIAGSNLAISDDFDNSGNSGNLPRLLPPLVHVAR